MNYVKTKIAEKIHVPELVETVRVQSTRQLKVVEEKFPYVHQTLPKHQMTDKQKKKLLKKIERLAKWLDNAVPHSPIPLGVDSILVKKKDLSCYKTHYLTIRLGIYSSYWWCNGRHMLTLSK